MAITSVKDVVRTAKAFLAELLADEGIINLGLEEIEFDEDQRCWRVTLGFSRPWNTVMRSAVTALTGDLAPKRAYRVLTIRDADQQVLSVKRREQSD